VAQRFERLAFEARRHAKSAPGLDAAGVGAGEVAAAVVTSVRPSTVPQRYLTRGLINGDGNHATLTSSGNQLVSLLTDEFPVTQ